MAQLDELFPGVTAIVRTFFENYKGKGVMQFLGTGDARAAMDEVQKGCVSYQRGAAEQAAGK